jgi:hypothetical protein
MGTWDHVRDELAQAAEAVARDGRPREVPCRGDDDTGLVSLAEAFGKPHGLTASVMPGEPRQFVVRYTRTAPA